MKNNQFEWFVVFMLTGYSSIKTFIIAENSIGIKQTIYLYLSVFLFLLWFVSAAKSGMFNIFKLIRKSIPFFIEEFRKLVIQSKTELKNWREHGDRNNR